MTGRYPATGRTRRRRLLHRARLPQLAWLTAVWVLLWGSASPLTVVGGVLVAVLVTAAFPLPLVPGHLPLRPWRLATLIGYLAVELLVSAVEVSWQTLRHGSRATAGVVEVPLLTDTDPVIVAVANAISMAPGEFVLQIDCARRVCYVYSLGLRTPADAQRVRADVLAVQRRVVAALGPPEEVAALGDPEGAAR